MSYLIPMDQVPAMIDRQSRKIFKRGSNQKIILIHPANRGIRVTS
jgi:hypothetical protein